MWPTAWCSTGEVTIRWPRALPAQAAPLSARLLASVPPEVKTISRGSAFERARDALVGVVERGPGRAARSRGPTTGCRTTSVRYGSIASSASGRSGVVAAWSR